MCANSLKPEIKQNNMTFKGYAKRILENPLTQIEMQMGFLIGILIGVSFSGVFILFFTDWAWYFKLFSLIGEVGLIGSLLLQLYMVIKSRKDYLEMQKEMDKINEESKKIIKDEILNSID